MRRKSSADTHLPLAVSEGDFRRSHLAPSRRCRAVNDCRYLRAKPREGKEAIMPSESDHDTRNAFTADFLNRLDEIGEPDSAHEADVSGPWAIRPVLYRGATGFALFREWESLEAGDVPYAVFRRRDLALLAAAVLPATGRELLIRLDTEPDADGFPLLSPSAPGGSRERAARPEHGGEIGAAEANPEHGRPRSGPTPASPIPTAPIAQTTSTSANSSDGARSNPAGHLREFDEGLAGALHVAAVLVRSPVAIAWLLEAAGHVALAQAGRILERRMR
jgi:hypothetical protein